jgi:CRP-like cAMP-binding protein
MDPKNALRGLRELAPLPDRDLRRLLEHFDEVLVPAGTRLATAGAPAAHYVVVLDGRLCSSRSGVVGTGSSAGWQPMWDRSCSPETVVADGPARLLVMGRAQFRAARAALIAD